MSFELPVPIIFLFFPFYSFLLIGSLGLLVMCNDSVTCNMQMAFSHSFVYFLLCVGKTLRLKSPNLLGIL